MLHLCKVNKSTMVTFLLILGGLIVFNFILLKFSIQSVDGGKKKSSSKNADLLANESLETETKRIPKAA